MRAALWSASYYRFFGARYGREQMPSGLRPMSCGETARVLRDLRAREPVVVRRCLSQMLASGYIPDEHNASQFRQLAQDVMRKIKPRASVDDAYAYLREKGLRDYAAPSEKGQLKVPKGPPNEPIAGPTVITFSGDIFTACKEMLIPRRFNVVSRISDPLNWRRMGPFWSGTGMIRRTWDRNNHDPNVQHGKVYERFVVNWNRLLLQEFKVHLRFTRRKTENTIRTDYSLIYEEEDQLLVDQGYGEVERVEGYRGWTRYTGVKTLKFASSTLNLLAPAVMAMFLEGNVTSFYDMFKPN